MKKAVSFFRSGVAALSAALCGAVLLSSCATIPPGKTAADWIALLPRDASYYVCLNTGRSRELVVNVLRRSPLSHPDIERLVQFTSWTYGAVKIIPGRKPDFSLITLGDYPFMLKRALDGSPDLQAVQADPPFWRLPRLGLEIALPYHYMVAVSGSDVSPIVRAARAGAVSSGITAVAAREIGENDFTIYFPLGWDDLFTAETGLTMPKRVFQEIWISARLRDDRYYFSGVFHAGPDVDVQSLKKLLHFFFLALFRRIETEGMGKRLGAMTFTAGDSLITVGGFYLERKELEPLAAHILAGGL